MSKGRGEDAMEAYLRRHLQRAAEDATVTLEYHPQRADAYNKSPDFIIDAVVRVELLPNCPVVVRFPILVEVEAGAGFSGGKEDLDRFVARSRRGVDPLGPRIELPFVIATEAEAGCFETRDEELPVRFVIREIAIPDPE
ncbi:MAG: hypothetical protein H6742_14355 [Alphaproteobacteria bacterium]|nr:hypothetical protein [Alphaproteobacteria bacterium]